MFVGATAWLVGLSLSSWLLSDCGRGGGRCGCGDRDGLRFGLALDFDRLDNRSQRFGEFAMLDDFDGRRRGLFFGRCIGRLRRRRQRHMLARGNMGDFNFDRGWRWRRGGSQRRAEHDRFALINGEVPRQLARHERGHQTDHRAMK